MHHKAMQGGASAGALPMTAYVTVTLLENGVPAGESIRYLESNLNKMGENETYTMALTAYALQLAKSGKANAAWERLKAMKKTKGGFRFFDSGISFTVQKTAASTSPRRC